MSTYSIESWSQSKRDRFAPHKIILNKRNWVAVRLSTNRQLRTESHLRSKSEFALCAKIWNIINYATFSKREPFPANEPSIDVRFCKNLHDTMILNEFSRPPARKTEEFPEAKARSRTNPQPININTRDLYRLAGSETSRTRPSANKPKKFPDVKTRSQRIISTKQYAWTGELVSHQNRKRSINDFLYDETEDWSNSKKQKPDRNQIHAMKQHQWKSMYFTKVGKLSESEIHNYLKVRLKIDARFWIQRVTTSKLRRILIYSQEQEWALCYHLANEHGLRSFPK